MKEQPRSDSQWPDLAACRAALSQTRYLLLSLVPFHRDATGRIWVDRLWHRDLMTHLTYLSDLTVLTAEYPDRPANGDLVEVVAPEGVRLNFRRLCTVPRHGRDMLIALPGMVAAARSALRQADVVHSGVGGWPLPPGMILNPLALAQRKPLVTVIESAFWRIPPSQTATAKRRAIAAANERFARWSMRHARLAIYTHEGYRATLPPGPRTRAAVIPASWISASDILDPRAAEAAWQAKPVPVRFLFASRLVRQKGAEVVLDALALLDRRGLDIHVDVIGDGDLVPAFRQLQPRLQNIRLQVLDPVPYGAPFRRILDNAHAVLVPTTGDEQPRIIYDAFARAVPVIASDTPGNLSLVAEGHNGLIFPAGDAAALAERLAAAAADGEGLRRMGLAGIATGRAHTHEAMHLARARILAELFGRP